MKDIPQKVNGDYLDASEWNTVYDESKNVIVSTSQTLSESDVFQIAKAMAIYAAEGDYYEDTGTADTYVLQVPDAKKAPIIYSDGLRARFKVGNTNTGASTVNVASIGVKNIKKNNGADDLEAGDLTTGALAEIQYVTTSDIFELIWVSPIASKREIQHNTYLYAVDTGTANTYIATLNPAITAYRDGMAVYIKITNECTGDSTLNLNGVGAKQILDLDSRVMLGGELLAGVPYLFIYSSTADKFFLQSKPDSTGGFSTGDRIESYAAGKPGWLLMNDGGTIAKTSGATYNGEELRALFELLWNQQNNTKCPVSGGRGASGSADFDANKNLRLPLQASRASGSAGNGSGLTARALGDNTGEENHHLTIAEMPNHSHIEAQASEFPIYGASSVGPTARCQSETGDPKYNGYVSSEGGGVSHNTIQPTHFVNVFIKI